MATLLLAEHDNASLKDPTLKALSAAVALGAPVTVLVVGQGCGPAAEAAVGGMTERHPQGVRGVGRDRPSGGQQTLHHEGDLNLICGARADNRLLDRRRRVFGDDQTAPRRGCERHAARLAEHQGRTRV